MRRTSLLTSAAVIAAGLIVTMPLPHAAAVTETNNILVTNQYGGSTCGSTNHQVQIANAFTGAMVQDLNSPNSAWQIPNDAKPFDLNRKIVAVWGGHSSYTGTNGVGVYDRTTNQWTTSFGLPAFERGANSAHSVTVLPDGYFAVALTGQLNGAGSGYVVVLSPTGTIVDTEGLSSAHGVEWDASRSAVFAVGYNDVRKYSYSTVTHTLTQTGTYDIPGTDPGGHDLRRKRTADNDYFVTVNGQTYTFDPEAGTFTVLSMPSGHSGGVKSIDTRFDGITEFSKYQTDDFQFRDRATVSAASGYCLSGYKHGRWLYAAGENVYPEDAVNPLPQEPASSGIGYGFPMDHVASVQAAGADLAYGSFWVGEWVNDSGWGGLRSWLDKAIANDVTPVIQWYYWGDEINANCYQTTCGGDKTKANWDTLAGQLRNEIALKMQGRKAIVVLETEWHKNGMSTQSTFDGWLRNQMDILRSDTTEDIDVALGWGHWADSTSMTTYTQAGQYADLNSTMILFSCVRETRAKYTGAVDEIIADSTELKNRFGKPVIVSDLGLSTYSGSSSGDPAYPTAATPKDCIDSDNYETLQEAEFAEVFADKAALATAGVMAVVFRAYNDDWNRNPDGDHHRIAERWFGIVRDTATDPIRYKASYDDVINGIKGESGGGGGGGGGTGAEWSQEAESFTTKPVGGQCTSATASGGLCWNIWANGTISTTMTAATAGVKTVGVVAHGDPAGGIWPQMKVRVDGIEVMNVTVGTDQWAAYSAAVTLTAGTHTLAVEYTNDGSVLGNDRNLLVDVANVDPASRGWTKEAETFTTKTTGGEGSSSTASAGKFWNVWANGHIENTMTVGSTSQHELHVTARGSVAGGVWPIMKVYVDGTLVLTQTVASATFQTYQVRRTLSGGTRTLRIEFTNDALIGLEDRNLHVDVASLYT